MIGFDVGQGRLDARVGGDVNRINTVQTTRCLTACGTRSSARVRAVPSVLSSSSTQAHRFGLQN